MWLDVTYQILIILRFPIVLFTILLLVLLYLRHFSGFVLVFSTLKAAVQLLHRMLWLDERGGLDLENRYVWFCPSWGNEILLIRTAPVIKELDILRILNRFHNLKNDYHVTPKMTVRQLRFLYDSKGLISFVIISVFLFSMVFSLLYIRFIIYQVFSIHQEKVKFIFRQLLKATLWIHKKYILSP